MLAFDLGSEMIDVAPFPLLHTTAWSLVFTKLMWATDVVTNTALRLASTLFHNVIR